MVPGAPGPAGAGPLTGAVAVLGEAALVEPYALAGARVLPAGTRRRSGPRGATWPTTCSSSCSPLRPPRRSGSRSTAR